MGWLTLTCYKEGDVTVLFKLMRTILSLVRWRERTMSEHAKSHLFRDERKVAAGTKLSRIKT